ncbi:MAG: Txe/YoeB family addiction module toxin [Deinococcales bacterium]
MKSRKTVLTPKFFEDLNFWVQSNRKVALRILKLIEVVAQDPFVGIGKPEPLKHMEKTYWSRRINDEHRLLYEVLDTEIIFHKARFYYE